MLTRSQDPAMSDLIPHFDDDEPPRASSPTTSVRPSRAESPHSAAPHAPLIALAGDGRERDLGREPEHASAQGDSAKRVDNRLPWQLSYDERYPVKDPATYTEFEKRFGEEAAPNARVWKMYRDRANERDEDVIGSWDKTLDILLIFTGLFSAMATAFIIEAYKQLSPDLAEYAAMAYLTIHTNASAPIPKPEDFVVSKTALWTNGLWFSSLGLALLVALLAILAKQWLTEYSSRMRAPVSDQRRWVARHRFYNSALARYNLDIFISLLPVGLHLALFLFFIGLVVFLLAINVTLAAVIGSGVAVTALFYLLATLAPLHFGDCPTATPLLRFAKQRAWALLSRIRVRDRLRSLLRRLRDRFRSKRRLRSRSIHTDRSSNARPPFGEADLFCGKEEAHHVDALTYVVESSPAEDDVRVAVEAVGGLDPAVYHEFLRRWTPRTTNSVTQLRSATYRRLEQAKRHGAVAHEDVARAFRSALAVGDLIDYYDIREIAASVRTYDLSFMVLCQDFNTWELERISATLEQTSSAELTLPDGGGVLPSTVELVLGADWACLFRTDSPHVLAVLFAVSMAALPRRDPQSKFCQRVLDALERITRAVATKLGTEPPAIASHAAFAAFWGHAAVDVSTLASHKMYYRLAYTATLRLLARADEGISWANLERCLYPLCTRDFRDSNEWGTADLETAIAVLGKAEELSEPTQWTACLGRIVRQLLWKYRRQTMGVSDFAHSALHLADVFKSTNVDNNPCLPIASHNLSDDDGIADSFLNVLTPDDDTAANIPSTWQTLSQVESRCTVWLAVVISSHLVAVHLRRGNVTTLTAAFLAHLEIERVIKMDTTSAVKICVHIKQICPTWWDETSLKLLAITEDKWLSNRHISPTEFVDRVNRESPCWACAMQFHCSILVPPHIEGTPQLDISLEDAPGPAARSSGRASLLRHILPRFGRANEPSVEPDSNSDDAHDALELGRHPSVT